ncbi:MAG: fimbria/pilus outer membrane usher protein, partial [Glaciimonas sp.]|nr:fimbria/pilus outer membrane usher protein [Glaciimonas sp.]
STVDYWSHSVGRQTSFSAGYGSTWRKISWNLSAQRVLTQALSPTADRSQREQADDVFFGSGGTAGKTDNRLMLTLSMPFGNDVRAPSINSSLTHNTGENSTNNVQVGVSGTLDQDRTINYGLSGSHNKVNHGNSNDYFNANVAHQASAANVRAGYSQAGRYGQLSFSADGGIVAHPGGISFAQNLSDTIGIVD